MSEEKESRKRRCWYFQQGRHYSNPPPPAEPPVCMRSPLCKGCPFPGNGFICWSEEGTCMRTRLQKTKGGASYLLHEGVSCSEDGFHDSGGHFNPRKTQLPNHPVDFLPFMGNNRKAYMEVRNRMTFLPSFWEKRGKRLPAA